MNTRTRNVSERRRSTYDWPVRPRFDATNHGRGRLPGRRGDLHIQRRKRVPQCQCPPYGRPGVRPGPSVNAQYRQRLLRARGGQRDGGRRLHNFVAQVKNEAQVANSNGTSSDSSGNDSTTSGGTSSSLTCCPGRHISKPAIYHLQLYAN